MHAYPRRALILECCVYIMLDRDVPVGETSRQKLNFTLHPILSHTLLLVHV